jgi:heme-degrading monooxygenase HmoA
MTGARVQVLLFAAAPEDPDAVREAYQAISRRLVDTPGLLGNTLLERTDEPGRFVVVSEWRSLDAFLAWERSPGHRPATAALRPYHDRTTGVSFGVYRVAAEFRG